MAAIYDRITDNPITEGLQGCEVCDEAIIAARNIARRRNEEVLLVDDDGDWIVFPDGLIRYAGG